MSRVFVGVAIGADAIAAIWRARGRAMEWNASLASDGRGVPSTDVLRFAFAPLAALLPSDARVTLAVAILPPLVRVRRIELPRMCDEDRRLAVSRAAERHFVGLAEPVMCAVERRQRSGSIVPFLAAAASNAFISDLEQIAGEYGWVVDRFVSAHVGWLVAAKKQSAELRRGDGRVIVPGTSETTVLIVRRGALAIARRLRSNGLLLDDGASSKSTSGTRKTAPADPRSALGEVGSAHPRESAFHVFTKKHPVGQTGQRVMTGQMGNLFL
jgi:hypothetical protein